MEAVRVLSGGKLTHGAKKGLGACGSFAALRFEILTVVVGTKRSIGIDSQQAAAIAGLAAIGAEGAESRSTVTVAAMGYHPLCSLRIVEIPLDLRRTWDASSSSPLELAAKTGEKCRPGLAGRLAEWPTRGRANNRRICMGLINR